MNRKIITKMKKVTQIVMMEEKTKIIQKEKTEKPTNAQIKTLKHNCV
jgi:hypothetical protein